MKDLKKKLRSSLVEVKKQKENRMVESKIIESKIKLMLESIGDVKKFEKLSFERQWKIGVPLMQEIAKLQELHAHEGLISEQDGILGILGKLFGGGLSAGTETLFEAMIRSLLKKLGMDGFLADAVTFFFARNPGRILDSFRDCRAFSKNVGQAILEAYIEKLKREYKVTGVASDFIRNALLETLENSDFGQNLGDKFADIICSFFGSVKQKGETILNTMNPASPAVATN